jgi:acetyl-CoA carboxylase biotin carboxyl carrier protein
MDVATPGGRARQCGSAGNGGDHGAHHGRFYAQPEPGTAPFVALGAMAREDTMVALIEVMKVFNTVPAGVSGVVTEICVQDAEIIEYGQVMFRVRPTETASNDVPISAQGSHQ